MLFTKTGHFGILIHMSEFFPYSRPFAGFFAEFGEKITYDKGHSVVWGKEKSSWVFFQESGLTRVTFCLNDEDHRIIGYFLPGMVFAQSGSFMSEYDGDLYYITETRSVIYRMHRQTFLARLKRDPLLNQEYLSMALRNQLYLVDRIVYHGEKGLYAKCVRWLIFMAKFYGRTVGKGSELIVPITQETAANFLHSTRESLNTVMKRLATEGHIEVANKRIKIKNLALLRKEL